MFYQFRAFLRFYWSAVTKYQIHSPFVYGLATAVLDDRRWYYAFRDVEQLRIRMLASEAVLDVVDFGAGQSRGQHRRSIPHIVRRAGSNARQGRRLFRLAQYLAPKTMLELGSSVGISAMYLASAVRNAPFLSLEGCPQTAEVARGNLAWLGLKKAEVVTGAFEQTLLPALQQLQHVDLVYLDGNHRLEPTLQYFETCLPFVRNQTVFVLDDIHWSPEMQAAWQHIRQHQQVTLSIDFFDFALAFVNPDFREKQHWNIVPAKWKIWKFY
jgi:predicted O-methyltransferase YrrM